MERSTKEGSQWLSVTGSPLALGLQSFQGSRYMDIYRTIGLEWIGTCASINDYHQLNQLGEGSMYGHHDFNTSIYVSVAYGVVFRAREHTSSKIVALKQIRIPQEERQNGVPITALREISILRSLKHENIVNVLDVAVGENAMDEIYMVMEYCEQVSDP